MSANAPCRFTIAHTTRRGEVLRWRAGASDPHDADFEVVEVVEGFTVLDAAARERTYWRRDGVPLAPGHYVVNWPARLKTRLFNEDARFRGPFRTRRGAEAAMAQLRARRALQQRKGTAR